MSSILHVLHGAWRGATPPRPPDGDTAALRRFGPAVDAAVVEPRADRMMNPAGNPAATTASGVFNPLARVLRLRYGLAVTRRTPSRTRLLSDGRRRPSHGRDRHRLPGPVPHEDALRDGGEWYVKLRRRLWWPPPRNRRSPEAPSGTSRARTPSPDPDSRSQASSSQSPAGRYLG